MDEQRRSRLLFIVQTSDKQIDFQMNANELYSIKPATISHSEVDEWTGDEC